MTDQELKLHCFEMACKVIEVKPSSDLVMKEAQKLYEWVKGGE